MSCTVELVVPADADIEGMEAGSAVEIEVDEDQSVLGAARDAEIWLLADCQRGWCTTCAGNLLAGDLDHSRARQFLDVDVAADFALLRIALPRSDCRIEVGASREMLEHRAAYDGVDAARSAVRDAYSSL